MSTALPPSAVPAAWALARQAGVERPFVQPIPFPDLLAVDASLAWRLAHVLAEATAFQQALGDWVTTPVPKSQDVERALSGMRRGPTGPRWWRRVTRLVHRESVAQWRQTLEEFRGQAQARHRQTLALSQAAAQMLSYVEAATQNASSYPAAAREWLFQASLLVNTLTALQQRIGLRERMEADSLVLANRGLSALALLQNSRGLNEEQAWEQVRQRLDAPDQSGV